MLLQKRRQLFRVEILTGYGALKHFFNSPVPVVVPQPDTDRHRKSQLFPRGRVFRDVFPGHLPKQISIISVVHAGGQVQLVVGPTVDKVYDEVCKQGGFEVTVTISLSYKMRW